MQGKQAWCRRKIEKMIRLLIPFDPRVILEAVASLEVSSLVNISYYYLLSGLVISIGLWVLLLENSPSPHLTSLLGGRGEDGDWYELKYY